MLEVQQMTEEIPMWLRAARQFGGELAANEEPGDSYRGPDREDKESIAVYHPAGDWAQMPDEDKQAALAAWRGGYKAEKLEQDRI
jgi:hypothetical protein